VNPNVYIIAGPNGVGKRSVAREFLPNYASCRIFINADLIAAGMSPFDPGRAAFRAERPMLEEIETQADLGVDFGFETTLAGKGRFQVVRGLKRRGYEVHIFYLWVPSAELTLARIKERVLRGGHDVPEAIVSGRFGGLRGTFGAVSPITRAHPGVEARGRSPLIVTYRHSAFLSLLRYFFTSSPC
jgi:predicted ABC-type ATPase